MRRWWLELFHRNRRHIQGLGKPSIPPTNLHVVHQAYQPGQMAPLILTDKLRRIAHHAFFHKAKDARPDGCYPDRLLDHHPDYTIALGLYGHDGKVSIRSIGFFGITLHVVKETLQFSPTEVYTFSQMLQSQSLKAVMARWITCVEASFAHYEQHYTLVIENRFQAHPLMHCKPLPTAPAALFETKRQNVRELLDHYQDRKSYIHPNFHKEFEYRIAEPLRRLDPLLPADALEVKTLVQVGYQVLHDAENLSASLHAESQQEEADVIFSVAMERITQELLPKLQP